MKIALIGYRKQEKYSIGSPKDEDKVLLKLLRDKGLEVNYVIWNDEAVAWSEYDKIILKSPWDYHERLPEFMTWLARVQDLGVEIVNCAPIIHWNIDKHYLQDIENSGLAVIASAFFEMDTKPKLSDFFRTFDAEKLVMKPCVSASARNTFLITPGDVGEHEDRLHALLQKESFMVQPFVVEILQGELSFIFLGNKYSHSVIKLPKAGDFRVQHFHGGTVLKYDPDQKLIDTAQRYVDEHAPGCLYARVDGVLINSGFQLMELELIEPYLFLDSSAGAYERYYEALQLML